MPSVVAGSGKLKGQGQIMFVPTTCQGGRELNQVHDWLLAGFGMHARHFHSACQAAGRCSVMKQAFGVVNLGRASWLRQHKCMYKAAQCLYDNAQAHCGGEQLSFCQRSQKSP